jgi:hypothetical protein
VCVSGKISVHFERETELETLCVGGCNWI